MKKEPNVFVDSNIILYEVDDHEPAKQAKARQALAPLGQRMYISMQVLQEVYTIASRPRGLSPADARSLVAVLAKGNVVLPGPELVLSAVDTRERYRISIWDALILEAAVEGNCDILYTEDLQHGQVIRGVKIINPLID